MTIFQVKWQRAASAGNVTHNDRRVHTELGGREKIVSNQRCGEWWRSTGVSNEIVWNQVVEIASPTEYRLTIRVGDPSVLHPIASMIELGALLHHGKT